MRKTVQNNLSLIGGLFFLAQSMMVPVASAATNLADNQAIYWQAATSADPIMFNGQNAAVSSIKVTDSASADSTVAKVIEETDQNVSIGKVIDNYQPSISDVKKYVLGEIKKAGLNVREAESLINCESRWNYQAINNKNRNGSNDKGLWQINSIHKSISDADKLDYKASTQWAIAKRLADGNWSAWSCANRRVAVKPVATETD